MKIVVTHDLGLTDEQKNRLKKLGNVKFYPTPKTPEDWLTSVKRADIICTEEFGFKQNLYNIKNVFVTFPFVSLGKIDMEKIRKNKVIISNSPGCNSDAVSEWIVAMTLNLLRKFPKFINTKEKPKKGFPEMTESLKFKKVTILGQGNIGKRVAELLTLFGPEIRFFTRGDNLYESIKEANVIINCLSHNSESEGLLDSRFFSTVNHAYYITAARQEIQDDKAMLKALKEKRLLGIATDCANAKIGDSDDPYFKKMSKINGVIATPHTAWNATISFYNGNEKVIENVEAFVKGKPINVLH